jgi:amino acid transporter
MFLLALVLFALVVFSVRKRDRWRRREEEIPVLVRALAAVLAAAIAAGAALWLAHLANEPDETNLAYLLTGTIAVGAVIYLVGVVPSHGRLALRARWVGWILMTLPLLVPSTFSLALPIVALLALALPSSPPMPEREPPPPDVAVPE